MINKNKFTSIALAIMTFSTLCLGVGSYYFFNKNRQISADYSKLQANNEKMAQELELLRKRPTPQAEPSCKSSEDELSRLKASIDAFSKQAASCDALKKTLIKSGKIKHE